MHDVKSVINVVVSMVYSLQFNQSSDVTSDSGYVLIYGTCDKLRFVNENLMAGNLIIDNLYIIFQWT